MSIYYPSFNYLEKNSKNDMGLVVSHLDGGDSGEVEPFLSMDPVYTDNYSGTRRIDYGAKYNSVAVFNITVIKKDGGDFSVSDVRNCLKWLTGAQSNSNLDLLIDDEVKYTFIGRFTNASHYKMDSRTIGLILEFTSISPWAYSAVKTETCSVVNEDNLSINCDTDDLYSSIYMKTIYANSNGNNVTITNTTTGDVTEIKTLAQNEIITLDNNMMITSDKKERVFGNDFNFVFPRLIPGKNEFIITGNGNIQFEYITPVKLGNVAMDINIYSDPICSEDDKILVEKLPWSRISETPKTLSGYDIRDAYTKTEVDQKFDNIRLTDIAWSQITHTPTTAEGYGLTDVYTKDTIDIMLEQFVSDDVYTKEEVDSLLSSANVEIDSDELNNMLAEILI